MVLLYLLLLFEVEICRCGVEGDDLERENNENKRIFGGVRVNKVFDFCLNLFKS